MWKHFTHILFYWFGFVASFLFFIFCFTLSFGFPPVLTVCPALISYLCVVPSLRPMFTLLHCLFVVLLVLVFVFVYLLLWFWPSPTVSLVIGAHIYDYCTKKQTNKQKTTVHSQKHRFMGFNISALRQSQADFVSGSRQQISNTFLKLFLPASSLQPHLRLRI